MTTSSQQPDYSTILSSDDIITISVPECSANQLDISSLSTVTLTPGQLGYTYDFSSGSSITLGPGLSGFSGTDWSSFQQTTFVNCFPSWQEVEKMRKEYPALDIAFKKFQEVYVMVEDDWQAQQGNKYGSNRS